MKRYGPLYNDINNLLAILSGMKIEKIVSEYYKKYNNDAPSEILKENIANLQKRLDEAQ